MSDKLYAATECVLIVSSALMFMAMICYPYLAIVFEMPLNKIPENSFYFKGVLLLAGLSGLCAISFIILNVLKFINK